MAKKYNAYKGKQQNKLDKLLKMSPAEREVYELRKKIALLERLPNSYRDMGVGTPDWTNYLKVCPEKRAEMQRWKTGVWYHIQELGPYELKMYGTEDCPNRQFYPYPNMELLPRNSTISWDFLTLIIQEYKELNDDFNEKGIWPEEFQFTRGFYIKGPESREICNALNRLARYADLPLRFLREYTDSQGREIGVVY